MINIFCVLIAFLFSTHCLNAQKAMQTDSCKVDTVQTRLDTIAKSSGKEVITCPKCNGKGYMIRETINSFITPKERKRCSICNAEYLDNIHHSHIECPQCHKKGYVDFRL